MKQTKIGRRNWFVLILLGLSGQIAWNVENSWFNTFVFDTITPDPQPIAVMVAVSAIVATLTTLIIGTLSDRLGRRRPFIFAGYVLWAISTIAFPMSGWAQSVQTAVFLVIVLDAAMTFFGSTANDAAFNAWVTDITDRSNRGTVEGVLVIIPVLAVIVGMGLSGLLIDRLGYLPFFLILGALVLIMGVAGSLLLRESPNLIARVESKQKNFFRELISVFTLRSFRENSELYLVFGAIAILNIGMQITSPFEVIYLNNYLDISKTMTGLITAMVAPVLIIFAIPIGKLSDRGSGFQVLAAGFTISAAGQLLFSMTSNFILLAVFGVLKSIGFLMMIILGSWARNLMPENSRGQFQGVRLIFMVMLPMIIGPAIGSALIEGFGIPTVLGGEAGFIPVPIIYRISACCILLSLIPVTMLRSRCKAKGIKM